MGRRLMRTWVIRDEGRLPSKREAHQEWSSVSAAELTGKSNKLSSRLVISKR